jgi:hypothetical protein
VKNFSAFAIFSGSLALAAIPLAAQDAPPAKPAAVAPITDAERPGVQQAVDLGWLVYSYDQAAWHGTDAMLEDVPDARTRGIAGWIVNDIADGWETVFFRPARDGGYEAVWAGVYDGRKVIRRTTYKAGDRAMTPDEAALVKATELARGQKVDRCSAKPFNTVVMPTGRGDGSLYAYLLTPQETTDAVPLGGHHRFEIVDGNVVSQRPFTRSCIALPLKQDGKRPNSLFITHLLDQTPTEIHVFSVYAAELPMFVSTGADRIWAVELSKGRPQIRPVRALSDQSGSP